MKLLYFNPETEYALASGASFYTPPAVVESMRRANQLLPISWGNSGDYILVDNITEVDESELASGFRLADWSMLSQLFNDNPDLQIDPWGWNRALVRKFLDNGVPAYNLPNDDTIRLIRNLAHRRTTILLNEEWNKTDGYVVKNDRQWNSGDDFFVDIPVELFSEDDCISFFQQNPYCWFKAPWSSSGRGVINTAADNLSVEQVRQWCHGIIRRQGSVLAETAADRAYDYATEWLMSDGSATFLGLSSFKTTSRGKYVSNSTLSQGLMISYFNRGSNLDLNLVVEIQKNIIEKYLKGYTGPLGIDMIIERNGHLRPFVELNLRHTMGMLTL